MDTSDPTEPSWQIGISHGGDLTLCLYVRDRLGLMPVMTPRLPAVAPEAPAYPAVPDHMRPELEAQWVRWWQDLLRANRGGSRRPLGEPADAFPELTSSPPLRDLVGAVASDGLAWAQARKDDFFDIFRSTTGRPSPVVELGNRYAVKSPFKLSVTCLPVNDKRAWRMDREHSLISYQLYADQESFSSWLEMAISSAAGGQ